MGRKHGRRVPADVRDGVAAHPLIPRERKAIAAMLNVNERTLRNWRERAAWEERARQGLEEMPRRQGRPRMPLATLKGHIRRLAEAWAHLTDGMKRADRLPGVPTLAAMVPGAPRYIAEKFVRRRKMLAHRKRCRRIVEARRHLTVLAPGVVATVDATQVGREGGKAIMGHVLRDRMSLKGTLVAVETSMTAEAFIDRVEESVADDALPLVVQNDNGTQYCSQANTAWARARRVIRYVSLPHTPQHNPVAEQGMKEVDSYVPAEGFSSREEALPGLAKALHALNTIRPRPSRGGLTSEQLHHTHHRAFDREKCYADYVRLKWQFTRGLKPRSRARRKADRRAVEEMLVMNGLATITTGALRPRKALRWKG